MKKNSLHLICLTCLLLLAHTVLQAQELLKLTLVGDTVTRGETLCVKMKADGFTDLTKVQFSLYYFSGNVEYLSYQKNAALTGNFSVQQTNLDFLVVNWESNGAGVTLPNGSEVMELCFNTIRAIVSPVGFSDYPTPIRAENAANQQVEVSFKDTKVSALPDEAIGLAVSDTVLAPGQSACVRVGVGSFNDVLLSMQFSLNWDASLLRLDSVRNIALPRATPQRNFNLNITNQGKLSFLWYNEENSAAGIDLQNGDTFFELCFTALDNEGATAIDFGNSPTPTELIDIEGDILNLYSLPGTVTLDSDPFIRPGDTNRDGVVNHVDLLHIGLGFGNQGPHRQNTTIEWNDLPVADWSSNTPGSQTNFKHLDTDGNGLIETKDLNAVLENWGATSTSQELKPKDQLSPRSGAPLFVASHSVKPGELAIFDLVLGEMTQPAINVYGLAFSIKYDPALVVPGSVKMNFDNCWLKDDASKLLTVQYNYPEEGRIDVAISGSNLQDRSGFGAIGQLQLQIAAQVQSENLHFDIENVHLINSSELEQAAAPRETVSAIDLSTGVDNPALAQRIQVFPNPVSSRLFLRTDGLNIEQVKVFAANGRLIQFVKNSNEVNVEQLPNGIYSLQLTTSEGIVNQRFVINR